MGDTLQYRRVIGLQYSLGKGEIKINMDGTNDDYYSNVDEIQIDPRNIDLNTLQLEKEAVTMQFSKPIICNIKSGKYLSTMLCGAKFEGKEIGFDEKNPKDRCFWDYIPYGRARSSCLFQVRFIQQRSMEKG